MRKRRPGRRLAGVAAAAAGAREAPERRGDLEFGGFFKHGEAPLCVYARERGGQWGAAAGSSRIPGVNRVRGAYSFNKAYHWVDMSRVPLADGVARGPVRVRIVPDAWVPSRHRGFTVDLDVEFRMAADGTADGMCRVVKVNTDDPTGADLGRGGKIAGQSKPYTPDPMPDEFTLGVFAAPARADKQP